ncbi:rubredoxin [archaeon CG_4_10_14_0_2_um_filter_Archaea_38_6]|nr:MAG: rubredoxin [archaeon CG07_land_8_20_14_0_80_38_8]PIU89481.1 MAG: rubredoxin [archaeon CG06_land_8_20_14_3_00_37_11]PIX42619.1 MAG: rubredoxin [archaeon CG_4_8_14_3_um_filter_38_5]PJA22138.1 MAG: rubredoxin [archaeon CG_4_10_14_0_2_um_filter_Archaea_38_6]
MVLYQCQNCGYVSDYAVTVCPKCGSKNIKKFSGKEEKLIKKSRKTNYLHMKLTRFLVKIKKYAENGVKENLDPACVKIFKEVEHNCYESYQKIVAELQTHMKGKKWG